MRVTGGTGSQALSSEGEESSRVGPVRNWGLRGDWPTGRGEEEPV